MSGYEHEHRTEAVRRWTTQYGTAATVLVVPEASEVMWVKDVPKKSHVKVNLQTEADHERNRLFWEKQLAAVRVVVGHPEVNRGVGVGGRGRRVVRCGLRQRAEAVEVEVVGSGDGRVLAVLPCTTSGEGWMRPRPKKNKGRLSNRRATPCRGHGSVGVAVAGATLCWKPSLFAAPTHG